MKLLPLILALLLSAATLQAQTIGFQPPPGIKTADEGTDQAGRQTRINCTGTPITCTVSGATTTINVTGGGGGGNFLEVSVNFGNPLLGQMDDWTDVYGHARIWQGVAWGDSAGRFVAVSNAGAFISSTDGHYWILGSMPEANNYQAVTWSPELDLFVAVASTGTNRVATSPDGLNWTPRAAAEANAWESVAWSPGLSLFAAVSTNGTNRVMTSPDGITWTARTAAELNPWVDVVWADSIGLFVAVSQSGTNQVMTSSNGTTWSPQAEAEAVTWQSVTWSPELDILVAVASGGAGGRVMTSPDGITWTSRTIGSTSGFNDVEWSPHLGKFLTFKGFDSDQTGLGFTSSNGIDWFPFGGLNTEGNWTSGIWSEDLRRWVIVSNTTTPVFGGVIVSETIYVSGYVYSATVTGQSWVAADSKIICNPFGTTADGQTVETYAAANLQAVVSDRVASTGFTLNITNPYGAIGTFRFHCTGS